MYEDKVSGPATIGQETPKKESEISREIGTQNMLISDLGDAFGRLVDKISPVLAHMDQSKESGNPESISMTDIGRLISENNKRLAELIRAMKSVRNRVEV